MTARFKIKQVADASGFTATTLRYYEQIGLLPESTRTQAGYRTYDEQTLDRLAFIARAKQLGCTLDEIVRLTTAWNGGQCGPIQDQLRTLVAEKITASATQIDELATFASQLRTAAAALEQHRPDGACDADCGCVSDPPLATIQAVALSAKPQAVGSPDIACTLSASSMSGRIADWQQLLAHVDRRDAIDGGVRCTFNHAAPAGELMRLVAAEQECCQFFRFAITVDTRGISLEIRAPADALPIATLMFGSPS